MPAGGSKAQPPPWLVYWSLASLHLGVPSPMRWLVSPPLYYWLIALAVCLFSATAAFNFLRLPVFRNKSFIEKKKDHGDTTFITTTLSGVPVSILKGDVVMDSGYVRIDSSWEFSADYYEEKLSLIHI